MSPVQNQHVFNVFSKQRITLCRCVLGMLCAVAIQVPAQTLEQRLRELPMIQVDIASMDFPPNAHRTESGRVSGKAIETIKTFCIVTRMHCEVIIYPTSRAYLSIENGTSDVLLTADIPAFERCCSYARWSYPFLAGLITNLSDDDIPGDEAALDGHTLVMVRGWQSIYAVFPNLKKLVSEGKVVLIETSSIASAIQIYHAGRASLLWGANVFEWYFDKLSIQWKEYNFKPSVESSAGIWISKQTEYHDEILNRFNLAFQLLKEQGNLDKDNFLIPSLMDKVYIDAATPK